MAIDYKNQPKVDFAVFPNKYAKTDRHPAEVGKIEFTREFMKVMVDEVREGRMPILKVAMWNRVSKAGAPYKNFRLELEHKREDAPVQKAEEKEDDGLDLPF
jgi:hypothetical protein